MAVNPDIRIISVATAPPDKGELQAYRPDVYYGIDDQHPRLYFALNSGIPCSPVEAQGKLERLESQAPDSLYWWSWLPLEDISAERRFGSYHLRLKAPCRAELKCYLWPARIVTFDKFTSMLEEIEDELGVSVRWDHERATTTRAYADGAAAGPGPDERLLDDIAHEIAMAWAMLRSPYDDAAAARIHGRANDGQDLPENRLVRAWAVRRLWAVDSLAKNLGAAIADFKQEEERAHANKKATEALRRRRQWLQELLQRTRTVRDQVRRIALMTQGLDASADIRLTAAMQRDYRLRKLLRAFVPASTDVMTRKEQRLSKLPPLRAPDVFELWVAVRLARWARASGWSGRPIPEAKGAAPRGQGGGVLRCRWTLRLNDRLLRLSFGIHPQVLDLKKVPPVMNRQTPAFEWAAEHQANPGLVSTKPNSPDFALTVAGPIGAAMVIGDASLIDVAYQHGRKAESIAAYRGSVAWLRRDRLVRCIPLGPFAAVPGPEPNGAPTEAVVDFKEAAAASDVLLLWMTPGEDRANEREAFEGLLSTLDRSLS